MNSPFELQKNLRMAAIKSMYFLSNLRYVGIFDYIEDT